MSGTVSIILNLLLFAYSGPHEVLHVSGISFFAVIRLCDEPGLLFTLKRKGH